MQLLNNCQEIMATIMISTHNLNDPYKKVIKSTPMLPPAWTMVLLHFRVGLSLYVDFPEWTSRESEGPWKLQLPFKGEHVEWTWTSRPSLRYLPQGQASNFPHDWLKISNSLRYPPYAWVDHQWVGSIKLKCYEAVSGDIFEHHQSTS